MRVGSKVVALQNHPDGLYAKGDVFEVIGVRPSFCKCTSDEINIGLKQYGELAHCFTCGAFFRDTSSFCWQDSIDFREIDTHPELSELTYEDIMTEIEEQELQTA